MDPAGRAAQAVRKKEPLQGHPRYRKIKDVAAGAFGFVQLAQDLQNGSLVAIKFMERGNKITK